MSDILTVPKKVKIGSMEYNVNLEGEPIVCEGRLYDGLILYDELLIRLHSNRATPRVEETFLHEILHGILRERDINFGEDEEEVVEMLGKAMYQFIKENQIIFKGEQKWKLK